MTRRFTAAAEWLHRSGVAVAAVVLFVNDHVLKSHYGNWLTGKLSDGAGLYLVAFVSIAVVSVLDAKAAQNPVVQRGILTTAAAIFCVVKTTHLGADAYGQLIGWLRAPVRAVASPAGADSWLTPIDVVVDPSDLLALLTLLCVAWEWSRLNRPDEESRPPRCPAASDIEGTPPETSLV